MTRLRLLGMMAIVIAPLFVTAPAQAEVIYPWCLQSTRGDRNCGFVSEQQCRASKTGNADMCMVNGMYGYVRGAQPPKRKAPKRKRDRNY